MDALLPITSVSEYALPQYRLAQNLGLSTSKKGYIIFNQKNWGILASFLVDNTKRVTGEKFDGMTDGHCNADRTIYEAFHCAAEIVAAKRFGYGISVSDNCISIGDCCDSVNFYLAS